MCKLKRAHFQEYCTLHVTDSNFFESFLTLNEFYEREMQENKYVKGVSLLEEYRFFNEDINKPDDDKWIVKVSRAREEAL